MNGKFDNDGFLWIERKGTLTECSCIYAATMPDNEQCTLCGEWCPQMGEPERDIIINSATSEVLYGNFQLKICQGRTLAFDKFEDERT